MPTVDTCPDSPPFVVQESDVKSQFKHLNAKKAPGPDGISPRLLKNCADQLSGVFTNIFNLSLELGKVPECFKKSVVIPVPKKPSISCLNDYRPVALTYVVMKSFERLILAFLKTILSHKFDAFQFAS